MADSCPLPLMLKIPSFSFRVLVSLDIVPNAPMTTGMTLYFEA